MKSGKDLWNERTGVLGPSLSASSDSIDVRIVHDLLGFQTHELGNRWWWKWIYEQNDGANDGLEE